MNSAFARKFLLHAVFAMATAGTPEIPGAQETATLPDYRPEQKVAGVIRSWGNPQMGAVLKRWQDGFRKFQPEVFFSDNLKSSAMAIFGLNEWAADLALMGRQIFTYEFYGVYRRSLLLPVEIEVATGSLDVPHKSFALAVFVHRDNPLARLTLAQLDGIFGDARTGGWQGLAWSKDAARTAQDNLRTWGQLGLGGEWAHASIHLYGPPGIYPGGVTFFQNRVLRGGDTWAEGLQEFADRAQMMAALDRDKFGIAYTGLCYQTAHTKPLALAARDGAPFVELTKANVASRAYPLARSIYVYFAPDTPGGEPANPKVDPKVREFLRYVLSRQGQEDVEREGDYLPLTAARAREQLSKLNPASASQ